jgi:glycosyltransferase involved in cell wall biosynthesis
MSQKDVIVVGQTPPPVHGQAVMIQRMLEGSYGDITLHHVPMRFSETLDEVGRFQWSKVAELVRIVIRVWRVQHRTGARVLYYPPAGPKLVPVLRDVLLLLATRGRFKKTIFHFHAGGLSTFVERLPSPLRLLARWGYAAPDVAVYVSNLSPRDGRALGAKWECTIPNGIPDIAQEVEHVTYEVSAPTPFHVLFVGALQESKGTMDLLHALHLVRQNGYRLQATLMGGFASDRFKSKVTRFISTHGLNDCVHLPGVVTGKAKLQSFANADLFCFPSYYESEAFPVVILEAMCFSLPVIATHWRGIPSQVIDGETGLLVPIQQPAAVANAIQRLIDDPEYCHKLGKAGRERYIEHFSLQRHYDRIRAMFERAFEDAIPP